MHQDSNLPTALHSAAHLPDMQTLTITQIVSFCTIKCTYLLIVKGCMNFRGAGKKIFTISGERKVSDYSLYAKLSWEAAGDSFVWNRR